MTSYIIGLLYILFGAVLWNGTAIIVQFLCEQYGFTSPFLITYIGCCLFIFMIKPSLEYEILSHGEKMRSKYVGRSTEPCTLSSSCDVKEDDEIEMGENSPLLVNNVTTKSATFHPSKDSNQRIEHDVKNKIMKQHMLAAIHVAPFWWLSNYCYNYSLSYTTITSSTIISNMGCVFTFLFSLGIGQEKYKNIKLLGVVLAFLGSVLTSLNDISPVSSETSTVESNTIYTNAKLWGDFAALLSALGHAGYTVMIRKVNPTNDCLNMSLLLGFVGLLLMLLLGPYAFYTVMTGVLFKTSNIYCRSWKIFAWLFLKGLFGNLLPDYFWGQSILLTSPTLATVGLNVTIPLAFISDTYIMHRDTITLSSVLGSILVIIGFLFVN